MNNPMPKNMLDKVFGESKESMTEFPDPLPRNWIVKITPGAGYELSGRIGVILGVGMRDLPLLGKMYIVGLAEPPTADYQYNVLLIAESQLIPLHPADQKDIENKAELDASDLMHHLLTSKMIDYAGKLKAETSSDGS